MIPKILYEDNHILIVDKPINMLVQSDKTGDLTLCEWTKSYIKKKYNKEGNVFCHPCHRLDRPVSGLVTFAKTSKALERMNALFRNQEIEKTYVAIVEGVPKVSDNELVHWLKKDSKKNIVKAFNKPKGDAKKAILSYSLLASYGSISLLEIKPQTGRPHQIRVQLKSNETPIKGDIKYGFKKANNNKGIDLHARKLEFTHPVKKIPIKVLSKPAWSEFEVFINELV